MISEKSENATTGVEIENDKEVNDSFAKESHELEEKDVEHSENYSRYLNFKEKLRRRRQDRGGAGAFARHAEEQRMIDTFLSDSSKLSYSQIEEFLASLPFDINEWFAPKGSLFWQFLSTRRLSFLDMEFEKKEFIFNILIKMGGDIPQQSHRTCDPVELNIRIGHLNMVILLLRSGLLFKFTMPKHIHLTRRSMNAYGALLTAIKNNTRRKLNPHIQEHNDRSQLICAYVASTLVKYHPDVVSLICEFATFQIHVNWQSWKPRVG